MVITNDVKDYERKRRASYDQPQPNPFTGIGSGKTPKKNLCPYVPGTSISRALDGLFCECEGGTEYYNQYPCFLNGLPDIALCNCDGDFETCHNETTLFGNNADTD